MGTEFRGVGKCGNIEIRITFLPKTARTLHEDGLLGKLRVFVAPSGRMTAFWDRDNPGVSFHLVTISVPSSLASASQFLCPHLIAACSQNESWRIATAGFGFTALTSWTYSSLYLHGVCYSRWKACARGFLVVFLSLGTYVFGLFLQYEWVSGSKKTFKNSICLQVIVKGLL